MVIRKFLLSTIVLGSLLLNNNASAEAPDESTDLRNAAFQLGFFHPLSTNGIVGDKTVNHASINMLYGHSAGLKGAEIAGLANHEKQFVHGFQAAGIANVNEGSLKGVQIAGLGNFDQGASEGLEIGGLFNMNAEEFSGFQASGLMNYTDGRMEGAQVSGLFNVANDVNGTQIGFINIANSYESGAPLGFLSIVKEGYNHVEAWGSEAFHANLSAKLGVKSFYNIFSVGKKFGKHSDLWGVGYGIGSYLPLNRKAGFNIDLLAYDVNSGNQFNDEMTMMTTLKLNGNYKTGAFEFFAGPSLNVLAMDEEAKRQEGSQSFKKAIAPSTIGEMKQNGNIFTGWIGANIGIRY